LRTGGGLSSKVHPISEATEQVYDTRNNQNENHITESTVRVQAKAPAEAKEVEDVFANLDDNEDES